MKTEPIYTEPTKVVAPEPYTGRLPWMSLHKHKSLKRLVYNDITITVVLLPPVLIGAFAWLMQLFWQEIDPVAGLIFWALSIPFALGVCAVVAYSPEVEQVSPVALPHTCSPPKRGGLPGKRWFCPVCQSQWRTPEPDDPITEPIPVVHYPPPVVWWETTDEWSLAS